MNVSIPRSGFWVFKPPVLLRKTAISNRFNPSVGILGVQARFALCPGSRMLLFQSLGRDSGCSSHEAEQEAIEEREVSIPRSGFWVFKPKRAAGRSWPLPWFQSLGRDSGCSSFRFPRSPTIH